MAKSPTKSVWWKDGVQFQCQQSGNCCISHGEYGYVYLTKEDRKNIAAVLCMPTAKFTKQYCKKTDGAFHLKEEGPACTFLKNNKCTVYKARPTQCRTWPFWPETMGAKSWKKDVVNFCPGVGKGKIWPAQKIIELVEEQAQWERDLIK
jgi:uncharacterized protein